jgi:arginine deiminase
MWEGGRRRVICRKERIVVADMVWNDILEKHRMENYPDFVPGKPPQLDRLHEISYLEELEKIWGKRWGSQGIGRLREVALLKVDPEYEGHPFFLKHPDFFLLRYNRRPDFDLLVRDQLAYAQVLEDQGVKVHWLEFEDRMGPYGPMRELFMGGSVRIFRGGAILERVGESSCYRGFARELQKLLTKIGCPILYTVHGNGIFEGGSCLPVAEDVLVIGLSCACNQEGLEQVKPVLKTCGVKEIHVSHMQTIMDSFESGGEFHIDMVLGVVDLRKAIVYPAGLDYQTYQWLKGKGFQLAEIPADEQFKYAPANLVVLEPGRVIMAKGARKTIKAVREMGVEVVEIDNEGIMQGGVNGISCITMQLVRDPGPGLDDYL